MYIWVLCSKQPSCHAIQPATSSGIAASERANRQLWHGMERGARSEWNGEKFGSYYMYIQQWHGVCQEKRTLVLAKGEGDGWWWDAEWVQNGGGMRGRIEGWRIHHPTFF